MKDAESQKAEMFLVPGDQIDVGMIVKLYEHIKGRKATEEEIANIKDEWEAEDDL